MGQTKDRQSDKHARRTLNLTRQTLNYDARKCCEAVEIDKNCACSRSDRLCIIMFSNICATSTRNLRAVKQGFVNKSFFGQKLLGLEVFQVCCVIFNVRHAFSLSSDLWAMTFWPLGIMTFGLWVLLHVGPVVSGPRGLWAQRTVECFLILFVFTHFVVLLFCMNFWSFEVCVFVSTFCPVVPLHP